MTPPTSTQLFNDTYAHVLPGLDEDAAAKVQQAIRGRAKVASG